MLLTPPFCFAPNGVLQIIVSMTAYHPNRATSEALTGLSRAQDALRFHQYAETVRNVDGVRARKLEFEKMQKEANLKVASDAPSAGTAPIITSTQKGRNS